MEESRLRTYSPLTLAFLGDAVFTLFMRDYVVRKGNTNVNSLHKTTVGFVSANAQEKAVMALMEGGELTAEELQERDTLRKAYIAEFRQSLQSQLDNTYIMDHKGNKKKLEKKH